MKTKIIATSIIFIFLFVNFTNFAGSEINSYVEKNSNFFYDCFYDTKKLNVSFESGKYTLYGEIFYPADETDIYPAIIFCEGYSAYTGSYYWIVEGLAEKGYVVMIFDYPGQGRSEGINRNKAIFFPKLYTYIRLGVLIEPAIQFLLGNWITATNDAIDFLLQESPIKDMIDKTSIGIIGHSLGSLAAIKTAIGDDRIKCVVSLSSSNPFIIDDCRVPIQFQAGDAERGYFSTSLQSLSYLRVDSPKQLIIIRRGTHAGFTNALGDFCRCPSWQKEIVFRYAAGWFDYFLKEDEEAYNILTSGDDNLSRLFKSKYNFGDGDKILN